MEGRNEPVNCLALIDLPGGCVDAGHNLQLLLDIWTVLVLEGCLNCLGGSNIILTVVVGDIRDDPEEINISIIKPVDGKSTP